MVSRENKRATLHDKLHLLRSNDKITEKSLGTITKALSSNFIPVSKSSIILEASNYIKDLKQKVTVETLEKGFLISVFSKKNCPGLLVSVLEVIEELGLNVLEARASYAAEFHLNAVGGEEEALLVEEEAHFVLQEEVVLVEENLHKVMEVKFKVELMVMEKVHVVVDMALEVEEEATLPISNVTFVKQCKRQNGSPNDQISPLTSQTVSASEEEQDQEWEREPPPPRPPEVPHPLGGDEYYEGY
ncbi:hypothetical protein KFK09_007254 [Dendrobium nobile]|uniref:Plant bHLH transcription factor ACT-like domain-containing protein n=1 Tax=Dendrobium nobile TaxID=94219 RepID=A0A8T3BWB7_DENNO|nr:hypothetical protein KFK09_007254 [Dendrobium nobile]